MKLIRAEGDVPRRVHALTTTRLGGVSAPPYQGLNLGDHVGDLDTSVAENRRKLIGALGLNTPPQWLTQVHGKNIVEARPDAIVREADGCFTATPGQACIVMTADCLPVLFANASGTQVAVAHAGWRGLAAGVLEQTVRTFSAVEPVFAWLGPAIGPLAFEVGAEVYDAFVNEQPEAETAFKPSPTHSDRYLADIYELARLRLRSVGVTQVTGGEHCTFTETEFFYSYRRDQHTGRMASVIWIE